MSRNPASNKLGPGISDGMIADAIRSSGYPLQLEVLSKLHGDFSLEEEWGYLDADTQSIRTIDLLAHKALYEWRSNADQPRVRPEVDFVIECKQSELPYIFFLSEGLPWVPHFPRIAGLKNNEEIPIVTDDHPSTWNLSPLALLDLEKAPFLIKEAPFCFTFSKCVRKGKNLSLDGGDAYLSIVLPILKAIAHFEKIQQPPSTAYYFDCHLAIGLAVIDAPMVGVRLTKVGSETACMPWIRVIRRQPPDRGHLRNMSRVVAVDMIHKDYLDTYFKEHALPFANEFGKHVLSHAQVLAEGKGFIPGMGADCWRNIEKRLQPLSMGKNLRRGKSILGHVKNTIHKSSKKGTRTD